MLPAFKASFEVANYSPSVEYLSEGGLYSGIFRKAFLYDKLASDGSNNTFICFEFLTRKEQKLAIFNLFVAKNNDFSYMGKNGELANKIFLDRIFNEKMQSMDEFQNNKEPLSIKSFKARHKSLNNDNNKSFIPKENQSYNPYGNEVKNNNNEKYIEIGDDDEGLPF
ncbi:hypothetical protein LZW12_08890 [Campylobacter coli]|nr:hypothetical protein [Campylobacter coli]